MTDFRGLDDPEQDTGPFLYAIHSIKGIFLAPTFTRLRHRYNGIRESSKVNLHADQMYMVIGKLYKLWRMFKQDYQNLLLWTHDGVVFANLEDENGEQVTLIGYDELFARVRNLKSRVEVLEDNKDGV